jgi:RNA polymerase primary sigma factor
MEKTAKEEKRLTLGEAEKKLDEIYEKEGIISEEGLQKVLSQSDLDENGFFEVINHLHQEGEDLDESSPEEKYFEDLEQTEDTYQPSKFETQFEASKEEESSLNMYFAEIGKYPLLTKEQEVELSKKIQKGDEDAKDELINSNLRLVASIASKYRRMDSSLSYQDLISYGNSGLITAASKFDYKKGCRFSTYASFWIRQAITRSIALYGHQIKIPVYIAGEIQKIRAARTKLTNSLNREPTSEDIAKDVGNGMTAGKVEEILSYDNNVVSLDKPTGNDEEGKLEDMFSDQSQQVDFASYPDEDINYALSTLNERERKLVEYRFGLGDQSPHTLEEAGVLEGVTRERARQIIASALKKMKAALVKGVSENNE